MQTDSETTKKGKTRILYGIAHAPEWEQLIEIVNKK